MKLMHMYGAVRPKTRGYLVVSTGWNESVRACYGFESFVYIRIWPGACFFANFASVYSVLSHED